MKQLFRIKTLALILGLTVMGLFRQLCADAQIVLHDASDVTQTSATLSADFPDLSAEHGFQYKYGTLPELDDFSRLALMALSDPVQLTTEGNAWQARTVKGWVESKSGLSAGESSVMSAQVIFSEETDITFEWSVDSEEGIGILSFLVDGTAVSSISGEVAFTTVSYTVQAGAHTLQWQYKKSAATNVGLDIGMVRNINLQNTTEGEWLQTSCPGSSVKLQNLYPGEDYLFRPYYSTTADLALGSMASFHTETVSIESTAVEAMTQTTATLLTPVVAGDMPLKASYLVEPVYTDADQKALLHRESDPVATLTKTAEWRVVDGKMACVSLFSSATLTITFTLTDTATISFDWAVKGVNSIYTARTSSMACLIDKSQVASLNATYNDQFTTKTFSKLLNQGTHTITWKPIVGYGDDYATVCNVKINHTDYDFSEQAREYSAVADGSQGIRCSLHGLNTDSRYLARLVVEPDYESDLPKRWNSSPVEKLYFRTLSVLADTLSCKNLSQASVTIRGQIDGGDAAVVAVGLQYKDATGTRWTDYPLSVGNSELEQTVTRLRPSTAYNYRSYIQAQDCDTVFSTVGEFTTLDVEARKPLPVRVTQHTAELQGRVASGDASVYQRGLQFRKVGDEEWEDTEDGGTDSLFTVNKTGLQLFTAYEARSYVQPAGGDIIYSDVLTFTTKNIELYVDSVTNVYQRTATLHGRVLSGDDAVQDVKVNVYRGSVPLGTPVAQLPVSVTNGSFAIEVAQLNPQTSYVFTAEATNSEGKSVKSQKDDAAIEDNDLLTSLLAPTSSRDVTVTSSTNWRANNDEGYVYCTYFRESQRFPLTVRVTLAEAVDISFDWMYYSPTYRSFYFTVDGTSVVAHSSDYTRRMVTETCHLAAGTHTLSWYEYWGNGSEADFRVANLYIPQESIVSGVTCTTTSYLDRWAKHESTTNTTATLTYKLNPTNERDMTFSLTANSSDDYLREILPEEVFEQYPISPNSGRRIISSAVGQLADSLVTFRFDNLFAGINYNCVVDIVSADDTSTQDLSGFFTKPYVVCPSEDEGWMGIGKVTDITQSSAVVENTLCRPLDSPITAAGYKYWPVDGGDTLTVAAQTTDSLMRANLTNLLPNKRYGFTYYVTVDGITFYSRDYVFGWSYSRATFTTLPVGLNIRTVEVTQVSATLSVTTDSGTASISNLRCRLNGELQPIVGGQLCIGGLNPNQMYTLLFEYEVGSETYEYSYAIQTLPIVFAVSKGDSWQTAGELRVTLDYGDAPFVGAGLLIIGDKSYALNDESGILHTTGSGSWLLTELAPGTSYSVEPYVILANNRYFYADRIDIQTKNLQMTTLRPTSISNRSVTLNGTISCDSYSSAEFGFQWKQMEGWNSEPAFTKGRKNDDGSIAVALVNGMLEPNTDYQYRTAVRYKDHVYYADDWQTFRTESEYVYYPATVYTVFRTDRENNCLILCGYYVAGSETVTAQGYEYWYNAAGTRSNSAEAAQAGNIVTVTTDESMQYSLDLQTLANGNYSVRAFVVTSTGKTIYGETLTFGVGDGAEAISSIDGGRASVSAAGLAVNVRGGKSLVCTVYTLNGIYVVGRKLTNDDETLELNRHGVYLVRLSNGRCCKMKL